MRVGIVYDSLFPVNTGGGERVYRRMAELLVERGHTVDYLTRRQWATDNPPATFSLVPVWSGEIYDAGGARTTSSAVAFAHGVYRQLRGNRGDYDLVVASALPVLTLLAARLALRRSRTFLVADWLEVWGAAKWRSYAGLVSGTIAAVLQWVGLRAADLHTVNSEFTASRIIRYRRHATPLVLGLLDLVPAATAPVKAANPPYALFVGRLIADKRVHVLPAAVATVPGLGLKIVGTGSELPTIEAAVGEFGVGELLGRVSEEELASLMASAAVLVNPSAREGFGLVVAEAAALGVPSVVVAGEDNAATELVVAGVNGDIAASVDAKILGAAIGRVGAADLRGSTLAWFTAARKDRGLSSSVDTILKRYADWSNRP